ncbi:TMEM175 family protein [Streptococcus catagoni]|uniref:TMEM175 family protein n=1 Tax=Streptococcus catagoni TaxID=2654874 RepID=UPI00140B5F6F|nr:TMEM175 family protein [Streptococcus catagoni]
MTHNIIKRFDALSDAIVAILMTILVLEIKIPSSQVGLPAFAYAVGTFLISFLIVFNFWYRPTQVISNVTEVRFSSFIQDVLAHMILALFPLAIKMLVAYDDKWVAILFFGIINLLTGLLLNRITIKLTTANLSEQFTGRKEQVHVFYQKRLLWFSMMDLLLMLLALVFNSFGIFLYLISPMVEFWFNYKRGLAFEAAVKKGYSFEAYLSGKFKKKLQ